MTTQVEMNTNVSELGRKAVEKWASRDKSGAQGDALGFVAIVNAFETMSFQAVWTEKEDGKQHIRRLDFDLKDYMTKEVKNPNGTRNNKATQARTLAIFDKVFGVSEPTPAQQQSLRRVVTLAQHFIDRGYTSSDCSINSRGYLEVPYVLMHDEPGEKASDRDHKTWKKNKDDTETLDNTAGMSVAKFSQRITPKRQANTTGGAADKSQQFTSSVKFVSAIIAEFNKPNGESDVAPNNELRGSLFDLKSALDAYFKADPMTSKAKKVA